MAWQFGCSVKDLQERIDAREFAYLAAYLQIEPPIEERLDRLMAVIALLITRIEGTLGGRPPKIGDKLIEWDKRPEDEQKAFAEWLKATLGGK